MSDFPEELYAGHPFDTKWISTNFDDMPEGAQVGIYVFAGTGTVKVRREAILIDQNNKIVRTVVQSDWAPKSPLPNADPA